MAEPSIACPRGHAGDEFHVRRDGWATTKDGRRQLYRCTAADGTAHRFYGPVAGESVADGRRTAYEVRCPRPGHKDAVIQSKGVRTLKTGTWRRFLCTRPDGTEHSFRLMVTEEGASTPVARAVPPPCPEHPTSKVVRAGTYGTRSTRQRYLCRPEEGKPHQFTPTLAREAVSPGKPCERCDELLSPHHGPLAASRHSHWTLVGVAKALNDLSLGDSYASVSLQLRAQRDEAREHLLDEHGIDAFTTRSAPAVATSTSSATREEKRNAWRVAADLVEQYSPPLFAEVDARYRAQTLAQRQANDAALAADPDALLVAPVVYILDELPVWSRDPTSKAKRPAWNVLTVVEVRWRSTGNPADLPQRETRLRLVRAFARVNSDAWQLVLDELDVRPDIIVSDAGTGLTSAVSAYYGPVVGVVPSMWHIHKNLRDTLTKLPNAWYMDGDEKALVDPLRKHLTRMTRDEFLGHTPADITAWWDDLEGIVTAVGAPVSTVRKLRSLHEPRLLAALPILVAHPQVPASNAGVENSIRLSLKPFLENRAHMFGNAERTNRLLNLLVCREAGMFTKLDALELRIRTMNEAAGGWAPEARQILDKQPPATGSRGKRYESLKSHAIIGKLAKDKGLATKAQVTAAAPPPKLSKQRPATIAALPIREWARSVGLPAGKTGPIKPSVKAAYAAVQSGKTDDEAKAVYTKAEAERLGANRKVINDTWGGNKGRARSAELAPLREWARENGIELPAKGTIPAAIKQAYKEAQENPTRKRRPSRQPKKTS